MFCARSQGEESRRITRHPGVLYAEFLSCMYSFNGAKELRVPINPTDILRNKKNYPSLTVLLKIPLTQRKIKCRAQERTPTHQTSTAWVCVAPDQIVRNNVPTRHNASGIIAEARERVCYNSNAYNACFWCNI